MVGEGIRVALTESVEESRRTLDVGEEKSEGAGRKLLLHKDWRKCAAIEGVKQAREAVGGEAE